MSTDKQQTQTTERVWAVDIEGGPLLACPTEASALLNQQVAEYECGYVAIVRHPEVS